MRVAYINIMRVVGWFALGPPLITRDTRAGLPFETNSNHAGRDVRTARCWRSALRAQVFDRARPAASGRGYRGMLNLRGRVAHATSCSSDCVAGIVYSLNVGSTFRATLRGAHDARSSKCRGYKTRQNLLAGFREPCPRPALVRGLFQPMGWNPYVQLCRSENILNLLRALHRCAALPFVHSFVSFASALCGWDLCSSAGNS